MVPATVPTSAQAKLVMDFTAAPTTTTETTQVIAVYRLQRQ